MTQKTNLRYASLTLAAGALSLAVSAASADILHLDDVIVDGSMCIGFDCVNGESFGFDTLRLKENNLRIHFQDTSNSASFPSNDWRLTANDTSNGGQNRFSIDDVDGGRTPFTIEAGAPSHSLYVDDGGRLGLGTSTPVVDIHVKSGNTPTLRLEQDGSSGFTPQTFDVASNEANFFIRDVTHGSALPFRVFPSAPTNALTIEGSTGDIGMGTTSPDDALDIEDLSASVALRLTNSTGAWRLNHNNNSGRLNIARDGANTPFKISTAAQNNLLSVGINAAGVDTAGLVTVDGDLNVTGTISVAGVQQHPDYVFAPDYQLMPLAEVEKFVIANRHLPKIPSGAEVQANGLNMTKMQLSLLEKVEELTLYTLQQQRLIEAMQTQMNALAD